MQSEHFVKALQIILDETFDQVHGIYLDKNTSLFETLATITADEASIPVGNQCATLAAQVKHVAFYLDVIERSTREPQFPKVDWGEIWRTVGSVTPREWQSIQDELRANYRRTLHWIENTPEWPGESEIVEAMAIVVHTAYHLGEIRQALCTIRPQAL